MIPGSVAIWTVPQKTKSSKEHLYDPPFQNSSRPEFQKAIAGAHSFAESDPNVLSTDLEVQLHKVQTEEYALISSRATLEYMQAVSRPLGIDLRIVGESLYSTPVALAVPSNSPLTPDLERV